VCLLAAFVRWYRYLHTRCGAVEFRILGLPGHWLPIMRGCGALVRSDRACFAAPPGTVLFLRRLGIFSCDGEAGILTVIDPQVPAPGPLEVVVPSGHVAIRPIGHPVVFVIVLVLVLRIGGAPQGLDGGFGRVGY